MIAIADILLLHEKSINDFGGSHGIRDIGLLESAIARPFQTFSRKELYPTVFEKAAALGESIIKNHPFIDGNKRTGLLAMISLLINNHYLLNASSEDLYNFIINISTNTLPFDEIFAWLKANTVEGK